MYDYATITKQNQIITEIQNTNEKIDTLNNNTELLISAIGVLQILCCILVISSLIMRCLGGRR